MGRRRFRRGQFRRSGVDVRFRFLVRSARRLVAGIRLVLRLPVRVRVGQVIRFLGIVRFLVRFALVAVRIAPSHGSSGSRATYGSGSSGSGRSGKVMTCRIAPSAASKSKPNTGSATGGNGLSISDFQIGDRITHDKFGTGTVVDLQDKGPKSVITVDFGTDGVKRLMLAVAPIEKL